MAELLWPALGPRGVEFRMNTKESLVLFRVMGGVLRPCQHLYIECGRSLDGGVTWKSYERLLCEVEVAGWIATWGGERVLDIMVKLKQLGAKSYLIWAPIVVLHDVIQRRTSVCNCTNASPLTCITSFLARYLSTGSWTGEAVHEELPLVLFPPKVIAGRPHP